MKMTIEILEEYNRFHNVVNVRVPGIYPKGNPLPIRMAKLVKPAAIALKKVYKDIVAEEGHLYISDIFRTAAQQQKAHEDWKIGRKKSFSPPSCGSVHEAARAIDIDAFDTGIGHKRVREILNAHGWVNIVKTLTGSECWHYEFRQMKWEKYKSDHNYKMMAHAMKKEIGNLIGADHAEKLKQQNRWIQSALNKILGKRIPSDGIYGEKTRNAVLEFQRRYKLQIDGVAGPITQAKMKKLLEK